MRGRVLNVQRMSTEDGPGLRTTVFLKGCPLACDWCHNPESLSPRPLVLWREVGCLACGACVAACPAGAVTLEDRAVDVDRARCDTCGACVDECPTGCLELLGGEREVDDVLAEVARDRAYFGAEGGLTLSGGEPTAQHAFASALLDGCRERGLPTALDTSGACSPSILLDLAWKADLVLYDLKLADDAAHVAHTGLSNGRIFENLAALAGQVRAKGRPRALWIRTPLIPGVTATPDNLRALGALLSELASGAVERWELCAFNNLCRDQYKPMGLAWPYADAPLLSAAEVRALVEVATTAVSGAFPVLATGATRAEEAAP
jgi:pyruvate formate lyase activating enzyme